MERMNQWLQSKFGAECAEEFEKITDVSAQVMMFLLSIPVMLLLWLPVSTYKAVKHLLMEVEHVERRRDS